MIYGPDPYRVVLPTSIMRHSQNWTPDFSKILKRGVKSIREEAQSKLTALSEPRTPFTRSHSRKPSSSRATPRRPGPGAMHSAHAT